jgi:hypothetical protein
MKLVTYIKEDREQLGVLIDSMIYDTEILHPDLPRHDEYVPELLGKMRILSRLPVSYC